MRATAGAAAVGLLLVGPSALAQDVEALRRALADQPLFPNLRGGSLGVPTLTAEGQVAAQGALRASSEGQPVLDLFTRLGNIRLNDRTTASLFAESAQLQAPRVSYDPRSTATPDPVLRVRDQSFQSIGFRFGVRLTSAPGASELASRCWAPLLEWHVDNPPGGPRPTSAPAVDRECPSAPAGSDLQRNRGAALTEYYHRLRSSIFVEGLHLFGGARYLYRGAPTAESAASGVSAELGLVHYTSNGWMFFGSGALTWLARSQSEEGNNVTVLPEVLELRATAGIAWRPLFDPARSATIGLQGSVSWNSWDNEFARGTQPLDVRGRAFEASVFLSGHLGTTFNGLISFGVLVPYGPADDSTPRFVFTFAPAAAAATGTKDDTGITSAAAGGGGP